MAQRRFLLLSALILCLAGLPALAGFEETHRFSGDRLTVRNLIGEVRVEGHDGSDFVVHVNVQGEDADESVRIEKRDGNRRELTVVFPEADRFVYPRMRGKTTLRSDGGNGWLSGWFGGNRTQVSGSGRGLEVWADLTIKVPRGGRLEMHHGVGDVTATNVRASLELSTRSGAVLVSGIDGNVEIDTGSGHVEVENVRGNVEVDTGSGSVDAKGLVGDKIHIDTGSGRVEIERVTGSHLDIDTGSGSVDAMEIQADSVMIDTGSGSVALELTRMGDEEFDIDTGSGSIRLYLPADASAKIVAETGSGGIRVNLDGEDYRVTRQERDRLDMEIGSGRARVSLDTGSGSIKISSTH